MFTDKQLKQSNIKIGVIGEDIACDILKKKGFNILFRNYKTKFGEIDIAAKHKDGRLSLIEVKAMRRGELSPEDNFSSNKRHKFARIVEVFVAKHPELIDEEKGYQMDLIAITINNVGEDILTNYNRYCEIKYYENV